MREEKWPTSNPDFYKLGDDEGKILSIKGNENLQEEFFNYALMFKKSAHNLTNRLGG